MHSAYNAILGRTALNAFQAIVSTYHMMMKFSAGTEIEQVWGDQYLSRRCYVQMVKQGKTMRKSQVEREREKKSINHQEKRISNRSLLRGVPEYK